MTKEVKVYEPSSCFPSALKRLLNEDNVYYCGVVSGSLQLRVRLRVVRFNELNANHKRPPSPQLRKLRVRDRAARIRFTDFLHFLYKEVRIIQRRRVAALILFSERYTTGLDDGNPGRMAYDTSGRRWFLVLREAISA